MADERHQAPIRGKDRVIGAAAGAGQLTGAAAGRGDAPDVAAPVTIVALGLTVGDEDDLGAIRRP